MTGHTTDIPLSKVALAAGVGYLIIFICGIFANFFILQALIVPEDAAATANNIIAGEGQFRLGILSFVIMVIFDVVLAWALYVFLKPVNESLSLLAAWLRLVNATIFGIALFNLFSVLHLLSGPAYLTSFETGQLQARMMLFLNAFNDTWLIGLIFFGLHLLLLGYLILRSGYVPKILGGLLLLAAFGYLLDSFANFLLPDYANYEEIFMLLVFVPGVIGELSFTLWLLFKGRKIPEIEA